MALIDEVKLRISTQRLLELTNPDDTAASTINDTLLTDATDDVQGDFEIFAGVAYDNTDKRHVSMAVPGVVLKLLMYKGEISFEEKHTLWQQRLVEHFKMVTGGNRIRPKSSSKLTPADENPSNTTVRPDFDIHEAFTDLVPEQSGQAGGNRGSFSV